MASKLNLPNLRHLREIVGLTQAQTAEKIGIDTSKIVRLENGSEPSSSDLLNIMDLFGLSLEELTGFEKTHPDAFYAKDEWNAFRSVQNKLLPQVQDAIHQWQTNSQNASVIPIAERLLQYLHLPKPSLAVVGGVSSGKSSIINALLGKQKLPAAYEGCTRTVIYLKHISDRPDFFRDTVSVFRRGDPSQPLWDISRIHDRDYYSNWLIASGDTDLLGEYGTYSGNKVSENVGAIVIFLDAPLLQNVDVVDCPGFFKDPEQVDPLVMQVLCRASIMLYLSPANNFLQMEDIIYLHKAIQSLPVLNKAPDSNLPPLYNLYIIASRAHMYLGKEDGEPGALLDRQCDQLYHVLDVSGYRLPDGNQISREALRMRFFTYTTNSPSLCSQFHKNLQTTVEDLSAEIASGYRNSIKCFVSNTMQNIDSMQSQMDGNHSDSTSAAHLKDRNEQFESTEKLISQHRKVCEQFIRQQYSEMVDINHMSTEIRNREIKNNKQSIQEFVSKIQQEFQLSCDKFVQDQLYALETEQKKLIPSVSFESSLSHPVFHRSSLSSIVSSPLITAATGSTILASSTAALFAPALLPFFLTATGVISATRAFTGNWEKNVARKIANVFGSSHTLENCLAANHKIWDECHQQLIKYKNAASLSDVIQGQRLATLKLFLAGISYMLE